jgi:hypothetical protein
MSWDRATRHFFPSSRDSIEQAERFVKGWRRLFFDIRIRNIP